MDASDRGKLLLKLADLMERDRAYLAVSKNVFANPFGSPNLYVFTPRQNDGCCYPNVCLSSVDMKNLNFLKRILRGSL